MHLTPWTIAGAVLLFVGTTVFTLLVGLFVVVRLPPDYFVTPRRPRPRHPLKHATIVVLKNLAGFALVAVGIALSVPGVPGQGLLTILVGVLLIDFPGKFRLEQRVIGRPLILAALNRIRARRGHPPLLPPPDGPS